MGKSGLVKPHQTFMYENSNEKDDIFCHQTLSWNKQTTKLWKFSIYSLPYETSNKNLEV